MAQEPRQARIFVSSALVSSAERGNDGKRHPGRPQLHTECLMLGMLAAKAVFGLGYRRTRQLFSDAGWPNLPDFRTLQWRSKRLRDNRVSMSIVWCDAPAALWIVAVKSKDGGHIRTAKVSTARAKDKVRALGTDYTELAL